MMLDSDASEWAATRLLDMARTAGDRVPGHWQGLARIPSRATRDKAMPVVPGRRRLSRLESVAGESAAAVTCLLDAFKARTDSGDPSLTHSPSPG